MGINVSQRAGRCGRLRSARPEFPRGIPVGSAWLEHATSAMSTLRS